MLCCQRNNKITVDEARSASRHNHAAQRGADEGRDGSFDFVGAPNIDRTQVHPERSCNGLNCGSLADPIRYGGISDYGYSLYCRRNLLQQFQPLCAQAVFELREAGCTAPGARQTFD